MEKEEINVTMEISNVITKLKVYANIFENSSHYADFKEHEMKEFLITFGLNLKNESSRLMMVINQLDEIHFRQNTKEELNVTMEISNSMTKLKVYAEIFYNYSYYVDFNEHEPQEFLITFGLNLNAESKNLMAVLNKLDEINFQQNTNKKEEK